MGFWLFLFIADLLIPATMIGFGYVFQHHPPKEINSVYGYRTSMSMKNVDTWRFAHRYCGKLWFRFGLLLLPITVAALCLVIGKDRDTIEDVGVLVCFAQMVPLIGALIPTEYALRKQFDKNGKRRKQSDDAKDDGEKGEWI